MIPWLNKNVPMKSDDGVPLACSKCPCEYSPTPQIWIKGAFIVYISDGGYFNRPYWKDYGCYNEAIDTVYPSPLAGGYCGNGTLMRFYVDGLDFAPYNIVPFWGDAFNHGPCLYERYKWIYHLCLADGMEVDRITPLVVPYPVISWVDPLYHGVQFSKVEPIRVPSDGSTVEQVYVPPSPFDRNIVNNQKYALAEYPGYFFSVSFQERLHLWHALYAADPGGPKNFYVSALDFGLGLPSEPISQLVHLKIWREE